MRLRSMTCLLVVACSTSAEDSAGPGDTTDSGSVDTADSGGSDTADTGDTGNVVLPGDLRLAIPAYAYPGSEAWAGFVAGAVATGGFMVMNPASGPGSVIDEVYVSAVAEAQAQGVLVLGYVPTGYGLREADEVDGDVNQYAFWYGVDGIFFDEVASDCPAFAPWYAERAEAANGLDADGDAFIAYNPGVITCADYLDAADVLVVAEDQLGNLHNFEAADWMADVDPGRFWLLAHDTSASVLGDALQWVRDNGIGWVYLTNDRMPNPWDALPSYWDEEVGAVSAD